MHRTVPSFRRLATAAAVLLAGAGGLLAVLPSRADTANNGVFRFLTQSLPDGSTNAEYVARLIVANADGPVTFGATGLPNGMAIDPQSGFITGRPTTTFNGNIALSAFDGTTTENKDVNLKVSASGGGGNAGSTFDQNSLPDGEVGTAYAATLSITNGVGPYTFGAADLPPGLTLDGETGSISGTPTAAGTFYASLTVVDAGENNKVVKVLPLRILPADSAFQFTTQFLNNGEVGTGYHDQWAVSGASGSVAFGASGLPAGLTLDGDTGLVTGTPTQAGTFSVRISATDAATTLTTNLTVIIAPSASSNLYWEFFGVPTALVNASYQRQPPILVAAKNGGTVTYAAVGIPAGMTYNPTTGELSGTPVEVGEYPVTFTATSSPGGEILTLSMDFLVLPPYGGDASSITVNFYPVKQVLKAGTAGKDSWAGQGVWNADRRALNLFDPATDALRLEIGSHGIDVPAGALTGTPANWKYASPAGESPAVKVQLSAVKQTLKWSVKNDTIAETVPATLRQTTIIGGRGYRLDEAFDEAGVFRPAPAIRRPAFVVVSGALSSGVAGRDKGKFSLLLADPALTFVEGASTLRFRLLDGAVVLFEREFTELGTGTSTIPPGLESPVWNLKSAKDPATADRIAKFSYAGVKGKLSLALSNLTLAGIPAGEAHLGFELVVGDRTYYTAATFFETSPGKYTTKGP